MNPFKPRKVSHFLMEYKRISDIENYMLLLNEEDEYDDEELENLWKSSNKETRDFWRPRNRNEQTHRFHKHPVLGLHGQRLSKLGKKSTYDLSEFHGGGSHNQFLEIMELESVYRDQLEDIAVEVAIELFTENEEQKEYLRGIISARIGKPDDDYEEFEIKRVEDEVDEYEYDKLDDRMEKAINKRITHNAIIQGQAVNAMLTLWPGNENVGKYRYVQQYIEEQIGNLDPTLLDLYKKFTPFSHKMYWDMPLNLNPYVLHSMVAGMESVRFDDDGEPIIIAYGDIFPILLQEICKGLMELLADNAMMHQEFTQEQMIRIYREADNSSDEIPLIQIGPILWQKFRSIMPKNVFMAEFILRVCLMSPDELHAFMNNVIENPTKAKQSAKQIAQQMQQSRQQSQQQDDFSDVEIPDHYEDDTPGPEIPDNYQDEDDIDPNDIPDFEDEDEDKDEDEDDDWLRQLGINPD